ncbi:hypothetical protein DE146DRAFT_631379 [Phaeosphaeria sp. MPI-PUGE-AT-0046c]|nr:hypothetical protein DE146DRAFT_631379 [Phaeosphaeria sp. MPI-PUGE-AT-0046c]
MIEGVVLLDFPSLQGAIDGLHLVLLPHTVAVTGAGTTAEEDGHRSLDLTAFEIPTVMARGIDYLQGVITMTTPDLVLLFETMTLTNTGYSRDRSPARPLRSRTPERRLSERYLSPRGGSRRSRSRRRSLVCEGSWDRSPVHHHVSRYARRSHSPLRRPSPAMRRDRSRSAVRGSTRPRRSTPPRRRSPSKGSSKVGALPPVLSKAQAAVSQNEREVLIVPLVCTDKHNQPSHGQHADLCAVKDEDST